MTTPDANGWAGPTHHSSATTKGETDAKLSLDVICYPENLIDGRRLALKGAEHQPYRNNKIDEQLAESWADEISAFPPVSEPSL